VIVDWYTPAVAVLPLHGTTVSNTQLELAGFFAIGLLGGAHCLGMCGPIVTMFSQQLSPDTGQSGDRLTTFEVRQHALFNLGRTVSYALLGGLFGLAGMLLFDASATVTRFDTGIRAVAGIVVGMFILSVGVRYTTGAHGSHSVLSGGPVGDLYRRISTKLHAWVTGSGIVALGLVHGLLPCPLLYPAFLYAFAKGSPVGGTLALGALGLGTVPTVFAYGTIVQSIDATRRATLHRVLGVAFLVMGWMPLAHGLELLGITLPHVEPPIYQPLTP
jgi:sulfite exporter TauE/SafE